MSAVKCCMARTVCFGWKLILLTAYRCLGSDKHQADAAATDFRSERLLMAVESSTEFCAQSFAYAPLCCNKSAWLPASTTLPSSKTTICKMNIDQQIVKQGTVVRAFRIRLSFYVWATSCCHEYWQLAPCIPGLIPNVIQQCACIYCNLLCVNVMDVNPAQWLFIAIQMQSLRLMTQGWCHIHASEHHAHAR